jgi:dTDP-4-dehydrorhamnose 3,5-epimerase
VKASDIGLGCHLIEPQVFGDDRGFFFESFNQPRWAAETGLDLSFVQANVSRSSRGVLRGLHFLWPQAQG